MKKDTEELTLVVQDKEGMYYMMPVKHMELNLVEPKQVKSLQRRLKNHKPVSATTVHPAGDSGTLSTEFRVVGVFDFTKDVRRKFVTPQTLRFPGLKRRSPPS